MRQILLLLGLTELKEPVRVARRQVQVHSENLLPILVGHRCGAQLGRQPHWLAAFGSLPHHAVGAFSARFFTPTVRDSMRARLSLPLRLRGLRRLKSDD